MKTITKSTAIAILVAMCNVNAQQMQTSIQPSVLSTSTAKGDLVSTARDGVIKISQKYQLQGFKQFSLGNEELSIAQARAGIRSNLSEDELQATIASMKKFYGALQVSATVQLKVPNSTDIVSYDCVPYDRQPAARQNGSSVNSQLSFDLNEKPPTESSVPQGTAQTSSNTLPTPVAAAAVSSDPKKYLVKNETASCPLGSVPIRRHTVAELLANPPSKGQLGVSTGPKSPGIDRNALRSLAGKQIVNVNPAVQVPYAHRYAHAVANVPNFGVSSRLNVWSPQVLPGDMSLSQVWVVGGDPDDGTLQTVEAGWQVMQLWQSPFSALFVYSTSDNYQTTGCYVSKCDVNVPAHDESFVIRNSKIIIGKPIEPQSVAIGPQSIINIKWVRSSATGSWWLKVSDDWVGFYPKSAFNSGALTNRADYVDFGGEATGYQPTSEMGSGKFAVTGKGNAAFQSQLQYIGLDGKLMSATVQPFATDVNCYSIVVNGPFDPEDSPGTYIFFGGPGSKQFAGQGSQANSCM